MPTPEWMKKYNMSEKGKARQSRYQDRNRLRIEELKKKPCMDCGRSYHPCQMDFDHRPEEEKVASIAKLRAVSVDRLMVEIAKCDLVCCLCHRARTWNRQHPKEQILVE